MSGRAHSRRQRWLSGVFVCALAVWAVDLWTGQGRPQHAHAAPAKPATVHNVAGDWEMLDALVTRLRGTAEGTTAQHRAARRARDLFMPGEAFAQTLFTEPETRSPESADRAIAVDPQAEFRERHQLRGIILGKRPLALVDDRVLTLHSVLDGFRLVTIERAHVVFVDASGAADPRPVVLELVGPEKGRSGGDGSPPVGAGTNAGSRAHAAPDVP